MGLGCSREQPDGVSITVRVRCVNECCSRKRMIVFLPNSHLERVQSLLTQLAVASIVDQDGLDPSTADVRRAAV